MRSELRDFAASVADDSAARSEMEARIERKMAQIVERKRRQEERRARRAASDAGNAQRGESGDASRPGAAASGGAGLQGTASASGGVPDQAVPESISPGVYVRLESGMTGEVVQVSGKKATVAVGEILTRVDVAKLTLLSANQYRSSVKSPVSVKSGVRLSSSISERKLNFKPSIDVRGMHLEEAIPAVTAFIDDAMMVGVSEVSILHGKGAGVLKEEIRKFLKITPGVVSFADEHVERGGSGITVVKLS